MLQNRVDPAGRIISTSARGSLMGNRGVIHNADKIIVRSHKHKAWITCALEFKGRHRSVMMPNRWTELFFLDEATAFAAGHRPCAECRRERFSLFKTCWLRGNLEYHFNQRTSIREIDAVIHAERIANNGSKITYMGNANDLPDGTFVELNEIPFLVSSGMLHRWTPFGYKQPIAIPTTIALKILTPRSIVNTFAAGYLVTWSPGRVVT